MKKPKTKKVNETTYCFLDGLNRASMYLLLGQEKALLIDTGNGVADVKGAVEAITSLPIVVVNSHGHFDHTHSNYQFGSAYISDDEEFVLKNHNDPEWIQNFFSASLPGWFRALIKRQINQTAVSRPWKRLKLPAEGYFELGNRKVSFFNTPGHTPGSISFIDETQKTLFTGDTTCKMVLLNLPESTDVETFRDTIRTIMAVIQEKNIQTIYVGHAGMAISMELLKHFEQNCTNIMEGKISAKEKRSGRSKYGKSLLLFSPERIYKTQGEKP